MGVALAGQADRRSEAPLAHFLDHPVDERLPIVDDLAVETDATVLDAGDERTGVGELDLEVLEIDREDFSGNLRDGSKEFVAARGGATDRALHEIAREQRADGGLVAASNRRRH